MRMTRRNFAAGAAAVGLAAKMPAWAQAQQAMPKGRLATTAERGIAKGPFQPTWESLKAGYKPPQWFRDAKFGIWAHWSAQCVPEQGDWYARKMYMQGDPANTFHVKTYGHPSKFGFKDIDAMWKVEAWKPEELLNLYQKAGAQYFMALANHHDNFDNFNSKYHSWNSTRLGPMRDIIATWRKLVRDRGMKFAVSNHSPHAWHWLQTAYGYDPEGPMAGVRYDAYALQQGGMAAGKGTPWAGFDPNELYVGPSYVLPEGIKTAAEAHKWHDDHDAKWDENPPPAHPEFVNQWFMRCKDLLDTYEPDMIYFDDNELPLGQAGLDITAHYYNTSVAKHGGTEVVVTGKNIRPEYHGAIVLDLERGRTDKILDEPWQVDTCLGDWHYKRSIFEQHKYKTPKFVLQTLVDAVSKNGNLCLNVPIRGNGEIDSDERQIVENIGAWMHNNSEGIYGSRPFSIFGEGAPEGIKQGGFNEGKGRAYTAEDIRFTTKGGMLYAYAMTAPTDGTLRIRTLSTGGTTSVKKVAQVELLGATGALPFKQTAEALEIKIPQGLTGDLPIGLKIASVDGNTVGRSG